MTKFIRMELKDLLHIDFPVEDATIQKIIESSEISDVPKGTFVIEQGKVNRNLVFVLDGVFRVGFVFDGKEETWGFGGTGDSWLAVESFLNNEPARFAMQTLSSCTIRLLPFSELIRLSNECIDLMKWGKRVLLKQLYYFCYKYEYMMQGDAYERFKNFYCKRDDQYIQQIPLKYIAQYLNMSPETISRLRKRFVSQEIQ